MKVFNALLIGLMISFSAVAPTMAFAEGDAAPAVEAPAVEAPAVEAPAPAEQMDDMGFFAKVFEAIKNFGGLPWAAKIASICLLLVASMKVSFIAPLWMKLGSAKVFVAPALALIGGILNMETITLPGAMAYITAGFGAIAMHQILDAVKAIPGLGSMYVAIIDLISGLLRKPM